MTPEQIDDIQASFAKVAATAPSAAAMIEAAYPVKQAELADG